MLATITKLEKRKAFKTNNITVDKNNKILMDELSKILKKFDILKNEAMINNLSLMIDNGIFENLFERFDEFLTLPAAPSKRRLELIYVNPKLVEKIHKEKMSYKEKKRKYTLKQFFGKTNFKKKGLDKKNVSRDQEEELIKCFEMFFKEKDKHVSQGDLWFLLDFVLDPNKELNYINRLTTLRTMKGLHSTLKYKQLRYGEKTGTKMYDTFIKNQSRKNTLEYFIEKHGRDGKKIWDNLNAKRSEITKFNWSEDGFRKRFGKNWKDEHENWKSMITKNMDNLPTMRTASKSSLAVFLPVLEKFKNLDLNYQIGFDDSEEFIIDRWSYDLTIHDIDLIFEFQGKAFHPNPKWNKEKWNGWRQAVTKKDADQVFAQDLFKKDLAEENGFEVIYIWEENDTLDNIKFCIDIINERLK